MKSKSGDDPKAVEGVLSWRMPLEESYSDWTIEVTAVSPPAAVGGGKTSTPAPVACYHVHKAILAVGRKRSEYFARLFQSKAGFTENQSHTSRMELEKPAVEAFPILLDYLYSHSDDELPITHENSVALHYLGEYLDIHQLQTKVCEFWKKNLRRSDQFAVCYEQSKLFCDEKAYQTVVRRCSKYFPSIKPDSRLMQVSDAEFWLDVVNVRKKRRSAPHVKLSLLISTFCCSQQNGGMDAETFLKLTDAQVLPQIPPAHAVALMQLESALVPATAASHSTNELSVLQERCLQALVSWPDIHHASFLNEHAHVLCQPVLMRFATLALEHKDAKIEQGHRTTTVNAPEKIRNKRKINP